jgi:hypothetical protein
VRRRTTPINDEEGTSIGVVLAGVFLAAVITAFFVIPNLLGARVAAENGAAAHNLQVGLVAFKTFFSRQDNFSFISPSAMDGYEPSLSFTTGASTGPKSVSFAVSTTGNSIDSAALSVTGNCYYILDVERITVSHPVSGDFYSYAVQPSTCVANAAGTSGSTSSNGGGTGYDGGHKCRSDNESPHGEANEHFC